MSPTGHKFVYLYGITRKPAQAALKLEGVDGRSPVEIARHSGLLCWVTRVSPVEFGDELAANMENLDWLAPASVRHQRVVSAVHAITEILPARFGTVFRHEQALADELAEKKDDLLAAFNRISKADEWGVRVFFNQKASKAAVATARSGRDYLKAKSAIIQKKTSREPDPEINRFAQALQKLAVDTAEGGKVAAGLRNLHWQASLLIPRARRKQFEAAVTRFASDHKDDYRVECTGPWPPYSFVTRDSE